MTRIFALTNHKGGVGKSTSATNIALELTGVLKQMNAPNSRVLLIDTDSQSHATLVTTGRNDFGTDDSLHSVLMADRQIAPQVLSQVIQRFPANILVYLHIQEGKLVDLSGRSIAGKQHYNPPYDMIGEKQHLFNHAYSSDTDQVVLVEGQVDAVTFGEWHIPAVRLRG